jgi:4'-phosphopantetheinyl transferase
MLKIFSVKIEKQQQLSSGELPKKILQTVTGELIVRQILSDQFGTDPDTITFSSDAYGKPYCPALKQCHFNISHSGEWIVCALNNNPVGIDIQKIVPIARNRMDMTVVRFFHDDERIHYFNLKDDEKNAFFFTQWALKESYIKFQGKGLNIPLQGFSAFLDQKGRGSISDGGLISYFQQYDIDSNYKLVACSPDSSFPGSLKKISIPSITKV